MGWDLDSSTKIGDIASSVLKGGKPSAIFNDNINTKHSVKTFLTYFGSGNGGAKNELITDYWFIPILDNISPSSSDSLTPASNFAKCGFTGYDKGDLEYHILNVSIPTYGIETTSYQDITGSYTRPGQAIATATTKTFTVDMLNTKSNVIDFVFAQWIDEVGSTTWKYPSAPYATCRFTVIIFTPGTASGFPTITNLNLPAFGSFGSMPDTGSWFNDNITSNFNKLTSKLNPTNQSSVGNGSTVADKTIKQLASQNYTISTYTFNNCYPINIELYQATNDEKLKFTRTITFAFDTFAINANYPSPKYNSMLRAIGNTILGMGVNVLNKMTAIANDAIGSMLDKTVGKLTDKLSSYTAKGLADTFSATKKLTPSDTGKTAKYTFKNNNSVSGIKTSDITSSDIKRTFKSTF